MTAIASIRVMMVLMIFGFPYIIISQYAVDLNISASNIMEVAIVFLILSSRFRRHAKTVLVKRCWRSIRFCCNKASLNIRTNQIYPEIPQTTSSSNELE
ncbi:unnamed protein product [Rotaria magnacalcarata]|uniref:Uncharacterized protein n=1 Tax=Rotaria magnacalcarata TaxID=392030 RepID=A0A815F1U2_9BILA|nr:unnamed protein product [Rotaria magnacalcarata]